MTIHLNLSNIATPLASELSLRVSIVLIVKHNFIWEVQKDMLQMTCVIIDDGIASHIMAKLCMLAMDARNLLELCVELTRFFKIVIWHLNPMLMTMMESTPKCLITMMLTPIHMMCMLALR